MTTTIRTMVLGSVPRELAQAEVDRYSTPHRGLRVTSDGQRILNERGEVVAERTPTLPSRREALDRLSAYALRELDMHPELAKQGEDVAMRAANDAARKALPLFAQAAH